MTAQERSRQSAIAWRAADGIVRRGTVESSRGSSAPERTRRLLHPLLWRRTLETDEMRAQERVLLKSLSIEPLDAALQYDMFGQLDTEAITNLARTAFTQSNDLRFCSRGRHIAHLPRRFECPAGRIPSTRLTSLNVLMRCTFTTCLEIPAHQTHRLAGDCGRCGDVQCVGAASSLSQAPRASI